MHYAQGELPNVAEYYEDTGDTIGMFGRLFDVVRRTVSTCEGCAFEARRNCKDIPTCQNIIFLESTDEVKEGLYKLQGRLGPPVANWAERQPF